MKACVPNIMDTWTTTPGGHGEGNPPHTDAAGRPRAVASAASSLVAKVADKMRHHLVGLGLGEVVIEMKGVHISTSKPRAHPAADLR